MGMSNNSVSRWNWGVIAAFAAVYIIWGSTYLAIRLAIETMPPFLMAGLRFVISGVILYIWTAAQGAGRPTLANWRSTAIVGGLLLLGGNGLVTWSEQRLSSGLAALLVAMVPLWMVLLDWLRSGNRPGAPVIAGVLVGLGGIALLVSSGDSGSEMGIDLIGVAAVMLASFCWANGSLYARNAPLPKSSLQGTGMEMLIGGLLLLLAGTFTGEWARFDISAISMTSFLALLYLVVFGGIIAYSSYTWLLRVSTPARVATYAYVNPVVAVFLGWALADEPLTPRTLLSAAVIVGAVVIITTYRDRRARAKSVEAQVGVMQEEGV
jgi:drug/metabolite transporter (DMT)-like permease